MDKSDTLFGGRLVPAVPFADGHTEDVRVRQLPLADYERAFAVRDDEIALTALCCESVAPGATASGGAHSRDWALTLAPAGYEALYAAAREVNAAGFFAYSARRETRERELLTANLQLAAQMSPDTLRAAIEAGQKSTSPSSSPGSPRRLG